MALTVTATTPGASHTSTTASATLVPQLGQTFAVGDLIVVYLAMDNAGSAGSVLAFNGSATFTGFGTVQTANNILFDNGAAAAGVEHHIIYGTCTSARIATDTITLNFSPNVTAKCVLIYKVTGATGEQPQFNDSGTGAGATSAVPSITTNTIPVGAATMGFIAVETNGTVTADADTTNGSWSAQTTQVANTGTLLTSMRAASQFKVQTTTASTQTYNPTITSADELICWIMVNGVGIAPPAAIALTTTVPAPTVTGQRNVSTTPAAIALSAVTPAATASSPTSTKMYLGRTIAPRQISPATHLSTGWDLGNASDQSPNDLLLTTQIGAAAAGTAIGHTTSATLTQQTRFQQRFVSNDLAAGTIQAGTWTCAVGASETNVNANALWGVSVYVERANAVVGYIFDSTATVSTEPPTTVEGKVITFAGASQAVLTGDRLVLEVWTIATQSIATSYTLGTYHGGQTEPTEGLAMSASTVAAYLLSPDTVPLSAMPTAIVISPDVGNVVVPQPTARGQGVAFPAAIARSVVTPAATATNIAIATPAAIARTVVTPAPLPAGWPISETFTGTNGSAWYAGRWDAGSGQAPTIVGNRGDFTSAISTGDVEYAALKPALLANQNGRVEIRLDNFIVDTASLIYFTMNDLTVTGLSYGFLIATDGSSVQAGVPSYGTFTDSITLVANDTLHHRIVRDSITGLLQWFYWVNAATEPTTPNFEVYSFDVVSVDEFWIGRVQDDVHSVRYDNLTIVAPKAYPAAINIGPDFGTLLIPAPTVTGGTGAVNGTATPAAIALTAVTPAPTASGGSNTTPAAIARTVVVPAPTASGSTTTTPAAITLTVVVPAPTITGTASATPTAVTLAAVVPAPTASGNANTTPAAITLSAVVPAPTASGSTSTTPAAIALVAVLGAPTATGTANTTPAAIALVAVTPAPTVTGGTGASTTPAAITLSAVVPAPTASGSTSTTPAAVALTVVVPAPTATGGTGGTASPAAITLAAVLSAPTSSGTATTTPAAIALSAVVYDYLGYPVVSNASSTFGNTASAIAPMTVSGTVAGDLILVLVGSTTLVAPAGYTKLFEQATATSFTIWGRIATGTAADAFYSNTANQATYNMWRVTHHNVVTLASDIKVSSGATTATNTFDPPSLDAGSSDQWLWVAAAYYGSSIGGLFVNTAPTGYSGVVRGNSGGSGVASNTIWAWKQATAQTDDPATMTCSTASANVLSGVAVTLAIMPRTHTTVSGGTGATATPAAITLAATVPAPTASGSTTTTPAAIALAVVTPAPTATGTANTTPAAIALQAVVSAPTGSGSSTTTPAAIALAVVVPAPTATGSTSTTPAAIALVAVTSAPTVTGDARAPPATVALAATTPAPTATGGTGASTSPAAITLSATTPPAAGSGGSTTTPATIALATTLSAPTATGTAVTTPAAIALAATVPPPAGSGGSTTTPAAIPLAAVVPAPTATGGTGASTTPAAITLAAVVPAPTASGSTTTTPASIALAATLPAPTVTGSAVVFPAAIPLTVVTPAPTVSGASAGQATPAVIALSATIPPPTASGNSSTTPAAITLAATTPAGTESGGSTATPAAVARAVSVPSPAVSGGAATTPASIPLAASTPPPTASGATTTTPAAIALAATVPAPTSSGTATVTPAAIARTVVVPAPTTTGGTTSTANPAAITLAATVPAPTARGGAAATPAAIALAATIPAPAVTGGAVAFPAAITRTVSTPAPAASGSASGSANPPAVILAATVPDPTAVGITAATPATIALTVVVPAATASGTITGEALPAAIALAATVPAPAASGVVLQSYWGVIVG